MQEQLRKQRTKDTMLEAFRWNTSCLSGMSFQHRLFIAIAHADSGNLRRLEKAFPVEVKVYREYTGVTI